MVALSKLSRVQKLYIWLAGQHKDRVLLQGGGLRTERLLYSLIGADDLVVYGYQNPATFLERRGLLEHLGYGYYKLTAEGLEVYRELLAQRHRLQLDLEVKRVK